MKRFVGGKKDLNSELLSSINISYFKSPNPHKVHMAHGSAAGCGNTLQSGRAWV